MIEAILVPAPDGDLDPVERWLGERGLQTLTMRAGLLVTGDRAAFERVFGPLPEPLPRQEPVELRPPPDLADAVASVTIPPVPNVRG